MANSQANDAMIRRLERELEERNSAVQGIIGNAQDAERDLNDAEQTTLASLRDRMGELNVQINELEQTAAIAGQVNSRLKQLDEAIITGRRGLTPEDITYRSAGAYLLDYLEAANGSQKARERLEVFNRVAAHQKTSDNVGLIPDPVIGDLVNFIDAARPMVSWLGPRNMPSATWYRPKVTQNALVAKQGSAGAAADEKAELVSQKMTITRITATAITYGGYVNVSRQNIDFSSPDALDVVVQSLASQYAIETEAATGVLINAIANNIELAPVAAGTNPSAAELVAGLWAAVAAVYAGTKGQGRVALFVPPSRLGVWGSSFAPVNPQNAQSTGFNASDFGQGPIGNISGVPVIVSSGYPTVTNHWGSVVSSAAVEVYEQRVGMLQATEPSVLGVQVAYAGYFTPLTIEAAGVQRIVNLT